MTIRPAPQPSRPTATTIALATCAVLLGACSDAMPTGSAAAPGRAAASMVEDASAERGPYRAVTYVNPDLGAATANPDVQPGSSCERPDRHDRQQLSAPGTAARNVHVDACLFENATVAEGDESLVDAPTTFESEGVGLFSACPDPDNAGPRQAILSADRRRCTQTGFQLKGIGGDGEFHVRLNNTTATGGAGLQRVVWCHDPELNGCADATVRSTVTVSWTE
jgi:hypothetical protein